MEANSSTKDNIYEPWGHSDDETVNQSQEENYCMILPYKVSKMATFTELKSEIVVTRIWKEGEMNIRLQPGKMQKLQGYVI